MADYHPLIARAIANLPQNTAAARRALYERARSALATQLRNQAPALNDTEIARERRSLEDAIRKVEMEIHETLHPSPPEEPLGKNAAITSRAVARRTPLITMGVLATALVIALGLWATATKNAAQHALTDVPPAQSSSSRQVAAIAPSPWTEKDLLGDWEANEGLEVLRFGSERRFEARDGINFYSVKGEFAKTDEGFRVTIGSSDRFFRVIRLTATELVLRAGGATRDTAYKRRATSTTEVADQLRSLDGFRLGLTGTEIYATIKNQHLELTNKIIAGQNSIPGSDYSLYNLPGGDQIIVAKRLAFEYQKNFFAIDFYVPQSLRATPSLIRLNVGFRIQRIHYADSGEPNLTISAIAKDYTDKFGRSWSQSANSAMWYLTPAGNPPGTLARIMSGKCLDFESFITVIQVGFGVPQDMQHDYCGIGIAMEINEPTLVATPNKEGKFIFVKKQTVTTTKFDYDLLTRLVAAGNRT